MFGTGLLTNIAVGAVSVLIAILAIYLAFRFLGKVAKFLITVAVIGLILWFLLSNNVIQNIFGTQGAAATIGYLLKA